MIAQAGRRVQQPRSEPLGAEKWFKFDLNDRQKRDRCWRIRESWSRRIVWKNSQNDLSRKSRFRAPNLIRAGNCHDEAHGRATRGNIARAAEPLTNFPSRLPAAF
jgi:hypothetical protein